MHSNIPETQQEKPKRIALYRVNEDDFRNLDELSPLDPGRINGIVSECSVNPEARDAWFRLDEDEKIISVDNLTDSELKLLEKSESKRGKINVSLTVEEGGRYTLAQSRFVRVKSDQEGNDTSVFDLKPGTDINGVVNDVQSDRDGRNAVFSFEGDPTVFIAEGLTDLEQDRLVTSKSGKQRVRLKIEEHDSFTLTFKYRQWKPNMHRRQATMDELFEPASSGVAGFESLASGEPQVASLPETGNGSGPASGASSTQSPVVLIVPPPVVPDMGIGSLEPTEAIVGEPDEASSKKIAPGTAVPLTSLTEESTRRARGSKSIAELAAVVKEAAAKIPGTKNLMEKISQRRRR